MVDGWAKAETIAACVTAAAAASAVVVAVWIARKERELSRRVLAIESGRDDQAQLAREREFRAELEITSVGPPSASPEMFDFPVSVRNVGGRPSGLFWIVINADGRQLGRAQVGGLSEGANWTQNVQADQAPLPLELGDGPGGWKYTDAGDLTAEIVVDGEPVSRHVIRSG